MANKHPYSYNPKTKLFIWLLLSSVVSALLLQFVFNLVIEHFQIKQNVENIAWLIGPANAGGWFTFYYFMYDKHLWKLNPKCSNLNGIWLGVTFTTSQAWPHFSVMKIEQSSSEISIVIHVYCIDTANEDWAKKGKLLGIDTSENVHISGEVNEEIDIIINYKHTGHNKTKKDDKGRVVLAPQPNFYGTLWLRDVLDKNNCEMIGHIYTNKFNSITKKFGTAGELAFIKFPTKHRKYDDIFHEALEKGIYRELEEKKRPRQESTF